MKFIGICAIACLASAVVVVSAKVESKNTQNQKDLTEEATFGGVGPLAAIGYSIASLLTKIRDGYAPNYGYNSYINNRAGLGPFGSPRNNLLAQFFNHKSIRRPDYYANDILYPPFGLIGKKR